MKPQRSGWRVLPPVIILRYWLLQGSLYMNWSERLHRWTLELLIFLVTWALFLVFLSPGLAAALGFAVAHTISAVCNGHVFAMLTHDLFWFSPYKNRDKFINYVSTIADRLARKKPRTVCGVVFFGSLSRGVFRESSDLDLRVIAADGFWNALGAAHLVFLERLRASFAGFPLDIYMFHAGTEVNSKMDVANEVPVCLYRNGVTLDGVMPNLISFPDFKTEFLQGE